MYFSVQNSNFVSETSDLYSKLPDNILEKSIGFHEKVESKISDRTKTVEYLESRLPLSDLDQIARTIKQASSNSNVWVW